jgi:HKD family nuclease
MIESSFGADGYNIGINNGVAAGQTVHHLHVHIIPRRYGDVPDPRGGVRYVIPEKANYVRDAVPATNGVCSCEAPRRVLFTGGIDDPLLPHLKHHLALSQSVDIAVAFTMRSGLQLIQSYLQDVLDRGGKVRIVTGDYLGATDPDALLRLLDLNGPVECRVFETEGDTPKAAFAGSFHPKAYLFQHKDGSGAAFVGSSNLSLSALTTGVEWNYRVLKIRDRSGWGEVRQAFETLFISPNTVPLTPEWIDRYRRRRPVGARLASSTWCRTRCRKSRHRMSFKRRHWRPLKRRAGSGRLAGLVVLATGLGKTWLSAFDSKPFRRVLFVAHREEILGQALATFRAIRPHDSMGRYTGGEKSPAAAVLFASIQTLGRQAHLDRFAPDEFDYIVVDEFHHAEARTYRRLMDYFKPKVPSGSDGNAGANRWSRPISSLRRQPGVPLRLDRGHPSAAAVSVSLFRGPGHCRLSQYPLAK